MPYTFIFVVMTISLLSIFVHELGHVLAAKSVGVGVREVRLGVGLTVFSRTVQRTTWTLGVLPLAGEVKLSQPWEEGGPQLPAWVKLWILSGGVLVNAVFAAMLLSVIAWQNGPNSMEPQNLLSLGYALLEQGADELTFNTARLSILSLGCLFNTMMVACNLLPFPRLDGWRMLNIAKQIVRGLN